LEGTRHPIDTPERLKDAADYIHDEFENYGLHVSEQVFGLKGFDGSFRNIEGSLNDENDAQLLIVSHYDTVENCPGANDDASGVAVMLETARVLAEELSVRNVRFVSFTLEELNPAYVVRIREMMRRLGLTDSNGRYTSLHTHVALRKLHELHRKHWSAGKSSFEAFMEAARQLEGQIAEPELKYAHEAAELQKGIDGISWIGETGDVGSAFWVKNALRTNMKFNGALCLDTAGYTSDKEHSQTYPAAMDPKMAETQGVSSASVGDFLSVVADANSTHLLEAFSSQVGSGRVGLPTACLQVPFSFEQIASSMRDLIRADHATFWQQRIPALFLTDTADLRYPFYHTPADTIEKLDFNFMTKVCKAVVAAAVSLSAT
jgi:Zn-dependent M28 family amino/carboxypeptidase